METIAPISDETASSIMLGGILGFALGTILVIYLIWWLLQVIAYWRIFTKAGEPGWKSIIPAYNQYTLYKMTWKAPVFWVWLVFTVAVLVMYQQLSVSGDNASTLLVAATFIVLIILIAISLISYYKLAKSFGHGIGYAVGLFFLWPIFILILGFGSSEYKGADL